MGLADLVGRRKECPLAAVTLRVVVVALAAKEGRDAKEGREAGRVMSAWGMPVSAPALIGNGMPWYTMVPTGRPATFSAHVTGVEASADVQWPPLSSSV